jgi:hypothetical protein
MHVLLSHETRSNQSVVLALATSFQRKRASFSENVLRSNIYLYIYYYGTRRASNIFEGPMWYQKESVFSYWYSAY